jgi:hypothetical protein
MGATLAAILTSVVAFFLCLPAAFCLPSMRLLTAEGAARSGISAGLRVATVCARVTFVYCFTKFVA